MKKITTLFLSLLTTSISFSQELKERTEDINTMFKANYHVLASNKKVKQGLYQIFFKATDKVVAMGNYHQDTISGTWMFFSANGELEQRFNFTELRILYNKPQLDSNTLKYKFPLEITAKDTLVVPIKIGGLFYGYSFAMQPNIKILNYMKKVDIDDSKILQYFEIDKSGKLVSWKSVLVKGGKEFNNNLDDLSDFFKAFVPARLNGKNIPSTVIITTGTKIIKTMRFNY